MTSKFTLWLAEYEKLTKEVQGIPLINIKEVLSVGGQHSILSMGKDNKVEQDDHEIDPKYMRQYFTVNKDEFYDVLEILRTRVKEQRTFAINVCNALTEQAVPGVVMARMCGENVSGDAFDMLRLGTQKKMEELVQIARETVSPLDTFSITIPVAGRDFRWMRDIDENIRWGEISIIGWHAGNSSLEESALEEDMFFLTNFGFIEKAMRELSEKLSNFLVDGKNYPN